MAKKENKKKLKGLSGKEMEFWKEQIKAAINKKEKFEKKAKEALSYYRGKQGQNLLDQYPVVAIENKVFANVQSIVPSIALRNPKIITDPIKKPYTNKGGQLVDTMQASEAKAIQLNYYYRKLKTKRQLKKCTVDGLLYGLGLMRFGYTTRTEKVADDELKIINEIIREESPFAIRQSPFDFIKDPTSKDHLLDDARWVAFRCLKELEELKNDDSYKNTETLEPNFTIDLKDSNDSTSEDGSKAVLTPSDSSTGKSPWDRVEFWEVWDKKTGKVYAIVPGHDKEIQNRDWPLEYDGGFPVEVLFFSENPDGDYPIPDIDQYIDLQDVLNELNSAQITHVRNVSQRKYVASKGKLDDIEMQKLERGGDGTVLEVNGAAADAVVVLRDANITQDFYVALNSTRNAINQAGNVAAFESGGAQKFETAAEVQSINQGISVKRADRREAVEDFASRVAGKIDLILKQTLDEDEIPISRQDFGQVQRTAPDKISRIIGPDQSEYLVPWLKLSKEDIQGDYEYTIDVGSMQPVSDETRKRDIIQVAQFMAGNPYVNIFESTKALLDAFDIKNPNLLKDPQQVEQQQAQAAQAQQQAALAERQMKDQTDLQKTKMKSDTSLAVAQINTKGGVDAKNVDAQAKVGTQQLKNQSELQKALLSVAAKQGGRE